MEPIYIHKRPDGSIRRHEGPPIGEGDFILVEPAKEVAMTNLSSAKKPAKKHEWKFYAISSAMGAAGALIVELIKHFV